MVKIVKLLLLLKFCGLHKASYMNLSILGSQ